MAKALNVYRAIHLCEIVVNMKSWRAIFSKRWRLFKRSGRAGGCFGYVPDLSRALIMSYLVVWYRVSVNVFRREIHVTRVVVITFGGGGTQGLEHCYF